MLFVQSLDTYYHKQERSSEFARLRSGDAFRKIDCNQIKECEVMAQLVSLRYDEDGAVSPAQPYAEEYRQYGREIFTEGTKDRYDNYNRLLKFIRIFREEDDYRIMFCDENVEWCPTKRRGHNEAFHDPNSIFYHRDKLNETAFILKKTNMEGSCTTTDTSIRTARIGITDGTFTISSTAICPSGRKKCSL